MNEQRNNGRGIFYGVIGVATLVVAIIGATFAYFTATASNNIIAGNMATVKLSLAVEKVTTVDETEGGLIPMSNGMVETAINNTGDNVSCVDDNGNAVCQIYKITLTNDSSAGQFVDGYVALRGGSGLPTDYTEYVSGAKVNAAGEAVAIDGFGTTMRWAQAFVKDSKYTTAGTQTLGASSETVTFTALGNTKVAHDTANIRDENETMLVLTGDTDGDGVCDSNGDNAATDEVETDYTEAGCSVTQNGNAKGVLKPLSISGNTYNVVGTNYIRVSNHAWKTDGTAESYSRTDDVTSALVFNHSIAANGSETYYVVVWLSETGTNQTAGATVGGDTGYTNPAANNFFMGNVTFVSAQGSEVSATFAGYTRVQSDQADIGAAA